MNTFKQVEKLLFVIWHKTFLNKIKYVHLVFFLFVKFTNSIITYDIFTAHSMRISRYYCCEKKKENE